MWMTRSSGRFRSKSRSSQRIRSTSPTVRRSLPIRQWENPQPDGLSAETRYWIDDMYMLTILQLEAYRATGDKKFRPSISWGLRGRFLEAF
jgi:hypothetical protein